MEAGLEAGGVGGRGRAAVDHRDFDLVGTHAGAQRPARGQHGVVLGKQRHRAQLVGGPGHEAGGDARGVAEAHRGRLQGVGDVERAGHAQGVAGLRVPAQVPAQGPGTAAAGQRAAVRQFATAAGHVLVVPLQQRVGALHLPVAVDPGGGLDVLVVAQRLVVVQGVAGPGARRQVDFGDAAHPQHVLLIQAVDGVVVHAARARVDARFTHHGVAGVAQQRGAPVGLVHPFVLLLQRQRVAGVRAQGGAPRQAQLPRLAVAALRVHAAAGGVEVGPQHMAVRWRRAPHPALQAEGGLPLVAQRQPRVAEVTLGVGDLGDDVDGAAHGTGPVEEARGAADGLHPLHQPGVHRPRGDGVVLHGDAVVELAQAGGPEAPVEHRARRARLGREADAWHELEHVLRVQRADGLEAGAVDADDAGWGLARAQAQARAGGVGRVQPRQGRAGDLDPLGRRDVLRMDARRCGEAGRGGEGGQCEGEDRGGGRGRRRGARHIQRARRVTTFHERVRKGKAAWPPARGHAARRRAGRRTGRDGAWRSPGACAAPPRRRAPCKALRRRPAEGMHGVGRRWPDDAAGQRGLTEASATSPSRPIALP